MLLTWELGGGLGHVARLSPIAQGLAGRGHDVTVVLCQSELADSWFADLSCLKAPPTRPLPKTEHVPVRTFADILANLGWQSFDLLGASVSRWRIILEEAQPDILIMDHSPTALLASQGIKTRRVVVSNGFAIPPDASPLPAFDKLNHANPASSTVESRVLDTVNRYLQQINQPPLPRLGSFYTRVDESMLTVLRELDHYGPREGATYWGAWPGKAGKPSRWPKGSGPKVLAYLKPFPAIKPTLRMLQRSGLPVLLYLSGVSAEQAQRISTDHMHVVNEPLDLHQAAKQAELTICHAGPGAVTTALLAGVPLLLIPLQQEQLMLAARITQLGAAQIASPDSADQISQGLQRLLLEPLFTHAAEAFAKTYANYDSDLQIRRVVDRIEEVMMLQ